MGCEIQEAEYANNKQKDLCPICDNELKYWQTCTDTYQGMGPVEESDLGCINGCYGEQFSFGMTRIWIGSPKLGFEWGWGYNSKAEEVELQEIVIDACKKIMRKSNGLNRS